MAPPQAPSGATVSLTVNYQRPGELNRTLTAEATIQSGRRILSAAVSVRDDRGESIAIGVATLKMGPRHVQRSEPHAGSPGQPNTSASGRLPPG